jgi:hypothetical protein
VASDAELIYRVKDLNLTVGEDGTIHFFKVLKGLSRRHIALTKNGALSDIDEMDKDAGNAGYLSRQYSHLPNFTMDMNRSFRESKSPTKDNGFGSMMGSEVQMEDLVHVLARMIIKRQMKIYVNRLRFKKVGAASLNARRRSLSQGRDGSLESLSGREREAAAEEAGLKPAAEAGGGGAGSSITTESLPPIEKGKAAEPLPGYEM